MPAIFDPADSPIAAPNPIERALGLWSQPPPAPTAQSTVHSAPTVSSTPMPGQGVATDSSGKLPVSVPVQTIVVVSADPVNPVMGQMWYRQDTSQLCVRHDLSTTKRVTLA